MAVVHCRRSSGIVLRLYDMVDGPLGIKSARPKGDAVTLVPGRNEVDDEFWKAWLDGNKDDALLRDGVVRAEEEKEKPKE
jgi:hypothetical protein